MQIVNVPNKFTPKYKSIYPSYSSGQNMEELFYNLFLSQKDNIKTDLIYLPVFWTSYYVTHGYGSDINDLYQWLNTLDKSKKYFTIVQYASGIYIKNYDLDITVFSAGGGGLNINNGSMIKNIKFNGMSRVIFIGNKGKYDIPLLALPQFPLMNKNRDIFCSFIGRFDTHPCRIDMKNLLNKNENFKFYNSEGFEKYKDILNRSIFTLAPRGYGYTSFRIYEAILAGSIPIYIWDDKKVLPFEDELDWNKFAIIVHSSNIKDIPKLLQECDYKEMQKELMKIRERFTINYTFEYIQNILLR